MFRPSIQKTRVLVLLAIINVILFYIVSNTIIYKQREGYDLRVEAAEKMQNAITLLKNELGREFEWFDRDPFDTRLIFNRRFSPLLTDIGKYQAKATVLKPNFAALVVDNLIKAGVQKGDTVAVSMTGSMPGANIAVLMACETMDLHYVSISSLGASEWGATAMHASWPLMEKMLFDEKLISHTSNKFAYGGAADYVKRGNKSRQDYGGENQRFKLDSMMLTIYPEHSLSDLFTVFGLDSNNDQFSTNDKEYLMIGREYYALPLSIARRLEVYDFGSVSLDNQKFFLNAIDSYGKDRIFISNISIRTESDLKKNRKKNIYGKVPEALSALLKVCDKKNLECLEPTPYEKYADLNQNNKYDYGEEYLDINNNGNRDFNNKTLMNNKYRLEIKDSLKQNYDLSPYKVYINIGGGVASFGYRNQEKFEKKGFGLLQPDEVINILNENNKKTYKRGVISQFAEANIPIINFIEIEKLLKNVDLNYFNRKVFNDKFDSNNDNLIDIGKGNLYKVTSYNMTIVWIALIISLSLIIYIGTISYKQINSRMKDYNPNE
tara:strand:+ start:2076 stop:3725 length:1650 start_codon:yes stop_codon:yes gene_type:complete